MGSVTGTGAPFAQGAQEGSVHPGGGEATPVLSEAMIRKLRTYVYVPQDAVALIHRGMPATLKLDDLPGRAFHGTITRFADSLDLSTRTMVTEVDIENPQDELYPGMYANVSLQLERHPEALMLPDQALQVTPGGSHVFVVRDGLLSGLRLLQESTTAEK